MKKKIKTSFKWTMLASGYGKELVYNLYKHGTFVTTLKPMPKNAKENELTKE